MANEERIADRVEHWLDSLSTGQRNFLDKNFNRQQINMLRKYHSQLRNMDFFKRMSTLTKTRFLENLGAFQDQIGIRHQLPSLS